MTEARIFAMGWEIFRIAGALFRLVLEMKQGLIMSIFGRIAKPLMMLIVVTTCLLATQARAQYFGRNSVQLPSLGWMAMDSSFGAVNRIQWGMNDQVQVGTGYARDLADLKLWWLGETSIGFANVNYAGAPPSRVAISVQGSTGLRYNFWTERWRPFAGLMVEVLQIFNAQSNSLVPGRLATPTWGAFRPNIGLEWIFGSDMSVEGQAGYVLLMNFEDPVRHSMMIRLAYRLYF